MKLTTHQQQAFDRLRAFLQNDRDQVFILKGYAGTGKTTLVGQAAALLKKEERPFQLLATTGRAAKVLQNKTGYEAKTLHSCIYTFDDVAGASDGGDAAAGELYLNIYKSIYGMKGPALYRWYYTALTRAKEQLFLNDGWWVQGFDRRNPEAKRRFYKKK
jgi:superfamily I DNA/RNA helicase